MTTDGDDERVSLGPLHPVAALKALLKVDPDAPPAEDEPASDGKTKPQPE